MITFMASLFDRLKTNHFHMISNRLNFSYVHVMPLEMALTFLKDTTDPNLPEAREKCKKHLARFHRQLIARIVWL